MLRLTCVDLVPSNNIIFPDVYFPWGFSRCAKLQLLHWIFESFFPSFLRKLSSNRAQKAVEGRWVFAVFSSFAGSTWWPFRERDKRGKFCQARKERRLRQNWQLLFRQPSFVIMLWWTTSRGKYLVVMWIEILFICTGTEWLQLPENTARWIRPVV